MWHQHWLGPVPVAEPPGKAPACIYRPGYYRTHIFKHFILQDVSIKRLARTKPSKNKRFPFSSRFFLSEKRNIPALSKSLFVLAKIEIGQVKCVQNDMH